MKPIKQDDGRMVLNIDNEKDLRTYMQPQRLNILFQLEGRPQGMTAKQVADALGIAPSSAGHHLGKLEQLGLVELARTEMIHGFKAKFYKATDVTVNINVIRGAKGLLTGTLMQNIVSRQMGHVLDMSQLMEEGRLEKASGNATMNYGTIFMTPREAQDFLDGVSRYVNEHRIQRPGTQAFEYTLLMANLNLWQQHFEGGAGRPEHAGAGPEASAEPVEKVPRP